MARENGGFFVNPNSDDLTHRMMVDIRPNHYEDDTWSGGGLWDLGEEPVQPKVHKMKTRHQIPGKPYNWMDVAIRSNCCDDDTWSVGEFRDSE